MKAVPNMHRHGRFLASGLVLLSICAGLLADESLGQRSAHEALQRFDQNGNLQLDADELTRMFATWRTQRLQYVRVQKDDKRVPRTLETAIIRFVSPDGKRQVDLIGAIHVADASYYTELNRIFRDYDVVLYELIAPEGTRIPKGGRADAHPVGKLQASLKTMLDLSFQLEEVDYQAAQMVHADLSPEQFAARMKERGESFWQILMRMMTQASAQAGRGAGPSDSELFFALFAQDRPLRLKRILAEQFADMESQMAVFSGPEGSTLITERNKRALEVLEREWNRDRSRIAIFYGAGHLPDFAARLQEDFGLIATDTRWLVAWDLGDAAAKRKSTPADTDRSP